MTAAANQNPNQFVIGLGSNLDPEINLTSAVDQLAKKTKILAWSSVWQNPAVGSDGPDYLNAALQIETPLTLKQLKFQILCPLEKDLDRQRTEDKYSDRTIDLDILSFNGEGLDQELWTRAHVAVPAAEVAPRLVNPVSGETLQEAARRLLPEHNFTRRKDLSLNRVSGV